MIWSFFVEVALKSSAPSRFASVIVFWFLTIDEAKVAMAEIKKLQPNISAFQLRQSLPYPTPELMENFVGGLVMAGLGD